MTLERKAIRKAAVCALRGNTHAGDQVLDTEADPYRPSVDGPVVLGVYTLSDVIAAESMVDSPRSYGRNLELAVEVWVEESIEGQRREDLLDELGGQIERVFAWLVPRLHVVRANGVPLEVNPSKSRMDRVEIEVDRHGRDLPGIMRVVYLVHYSSEDLPEECGELAELEALDVGWEFPPPDLELEARDEIRDPPE